jgi:hypothetical protein
MARYEDVFILKDKVSDKLLDMTISMEKFNKKLGNTKERLEFFKKETENIAKLGNKIKDVGKGMTVGLTLPIVAAGGAAVKFASDYEEALNKVDVAFGNSSQAVKDWSKNSLTAMGISKGEALDSAALFGDMATGMGLSQEKASQMAMRLTQLGSDLASFKNISNDVAKTALKSIFTGETESLKNLGVVMTEANLQQYAYSKGIRKKIKSMSEAEKVNLRYNYVLEKTKNAHGDFERTGGGAANQMRIFQSTLKDLGETFGQYILPTFTSVLKNLNGMLKSFSQMPEPLKKSVIVLGALLAVLGPIVTVIGSVIAAVNGVTIALSVLAAHPIIAWLVGLTAAFATAYAIGKKLADLINSKRMQVSGLNLDNEDNLAYLSAKKAEMGDKEFKKKYGGKTAKADNNYDNSTSNSNNTTNITNNNYSAGANPKNAKYVRT